MILYFDFINLLFLIEMKKNVKNYLSSHKLNSHSNSIQLEVF